MFDYTINIMKMVWICVNMFIVWSDTNGKEYWYIQYYIDSDDYSGIYL